eukprot:210872_1
MKKLVFYFDIPWFLIVADFMLNVLIPIIITLMSLFLLTASETYLDLVLNAFALTFIAEIDDMLNVFESDEQDIIQCELELFVNYDGNHPDSTSKRKIILKKSSFYTILMIPFTIAIIIWKFFVYLKKFFIDKQAHQTIEYYLDARKEELYNYRQHENGGK